MNNSLFQVLLTSIKTKITPLYTKIRRWTDWNYIRTQGINKIRQFFTALLDVRPKHKKDYYEVFGWLISKKLAFALVVAIGVLSLYYIVNVREAYFPGKQDNGIKTYAYNSVPLRFAKNKVRIKGKSGYLAYEGDVANGYVTGQGTLYNPEGTVVYQGAFSKNKYEGRGVSYYDNGVMQYNGNFSENLYEGEGKLYSRNGSIAYDGQFARGKKEGEGILFDQSGNQVYHGNFSQDDIVFAELIGKSAEDVAKSYTGSQTNYAHGQSFAVIMNDIDAMYVGQRSETSLDDSVKVESIYVLRPYFHSGGNKYTTIDELRGIFGNPSFEGNSEVTMGEAVAINQLCTNRTVLFGPVEMGKTEEFDEYSVIDSFDQTYTVYLYGFQKDGLLYTFLCRDKNDVFAFYSITKEEGGAEP